MIRAALLGLVLLLTGCGPSSCVARVVEAPAAPPAAPATQPAHPAPVTGNQLADGVSNARPVDVVAWLLPWLAGLLTVGTVAAVVCAVWRRSASLAWLAAGLGASLGTVLVIKVALWTIGVIAALVALGLAILAGYLVRGLWRRRSDLLAWISRRIPRFSKATP